MFYSITADLKKCLSFIISLFLNLIIYCQDNIVGTWLTSDNKSHISIFKQEQYYHGKVSWVKDSIDPLTFKIVTDIHNPDPSQRKRQILGLSILNHFQYDSIKKIYRGGSFYFPRNGKAYRGKIWFLDSNTIMMRGYVLIFYSTDTWKRVK